MDGTTTFGKQHGVLLTRKTTAFLATIFIFAVIVTGILVYSLTSCSENQDIVNSCLQTQPSNNHTGTTLPTDVTEMYDGEASTPTTGPDETTNILEKKTVNVRLPKSVLPESYHIKIIPFITEGNFTFNGEVDIKVNVTEVTNNITLHYDDMEIDEPSVTVERLTDGWNIISVGVERIENDTTRQFLIIHLEEDLAVGTLYKVHIKYKGVLNDVLQGFYRSSYNIGNHTRWIATTQFQPTDARRAFPCFDEPAMKARFKIDLARPSSMSTVSNMPQRSTSEPVDNVPGYMWDYYKESVPMSTYLVAFAVTDFDHRTSGNFSVWTRKEALDQANYSLQIGPKILKHYEDFFQIPFPLPKIDMIALPDFSAGAMENWGLITYRETAMLYQEGVSTSINLQRIATVVAHELAHQWFGNLVTPTWWSDLWLNEGFATYVEYIGADAVEPDWKILDQFVTQQLHYAFALDALASSHQISIEVGHPDEINDIFDRISYAKGASVIRMMAHFLTKPVFKSGLTNYLKEKKFGNAEQIDLWTALTKEAHKSKILEEDVSVGQIMDTWTLQTGFPVVNVVRDYDSKSAGLTQERFLILGNDSKADNQNWWIPITYTHQKEMNFVETKTKYWIKNIPSLEIENMEAEKDEWIIVNLQETGYYRVNYDEDNWKMLSGHLQNSKTFKDIATLNRAQLLDDALNLARAGRLDYHMALNLSRYLVNEKDYVPWQAAFVGMAYLDHMFIRSGHYDKFKEYMLHLIQKQYEEIGFHEKSTDPQLTIYKRIDLLYWACTLGHQDCIRNSVTQFQNWKSLPNPDHNNPISPNIKSIVYCTALKVGGQEEWDFAWKRYINANVASEKEILMSAMGCIRETWILARYLEWAVTENSGIRKQDAPRVFAAVASNSVGQDLAFNFMRGNWLRIKEYMGASLSTVSSIVRVCTRHRNSIFDVRNLKDFSHEYGEDLGTPIRTVKQAIEDAEANVKWMNQNYENIVKWLTEWRTY